MRGGMGRSLSLRGYRMDSSRRRNSAVAEKILFSNRRHLEVGLPFPEIRRKQYQHSSRGAAESAWFFKLGGGSVRRYALSEGLRKPR